MLQQRKGSNFPHARTKPYPCQDKIFPVHGHQPNPGTMGGCPTHRLACKADFHERINQVLLVALEAKDLLDIVHDSIIHCEGKEMLKAHGTIWMALEGLSPSRAAQLH